MQGKHEGARLLATALGIYLLWVLATWILEGARLTLNRPEAVPDRLAYTLVANVFIGIFLVFLALRGIIREVPPRMLGFREPAWTLAGVVAAVITGTGILLLAGIPSWDPVVLANVYAQVLTVTIAEVLVCWVLVGGTVAAVAGSHGRPWGTLAGIASSSVLFGVYHLAHSPPFSEPGTILFLTAIGVATSLVFFAWGEVYTTIVFHNFFGVIGILQALAAGGVLGIYASPQYPLIILALVSLAVLILADRVIMRKKEYQAI